MRGNKGIKVGTKVHQGTLPSTIQKQNESLQVCTVLGTCAVGCGDECDNREGKRMIFARKRVNAVLEPKIKPGVRR